MHMATLTSAMRDGADLVAWAEPNTVALNDERVEAAVLRGLSTPVPPEFALGVPLLLHASTDVPPIPLIEAVMEDTRHDATTCDLCGAEGRSNSRLLVPSGASAVAVYCCFVCRATLDRTLARASVVWD